MALSGSTPDLECKSRCLRQPKAGTEGGRAPSTVLARDLYAANDLDAMNCHAFREEKSRLFLAGGHGSRRARANRGTRIGANKLARRRQLAPQSFRRRVQSRQAPFDQLAS